MLRPALPLYYALVSLYELRPLPPNVPVGMLRDEVLAFGEAMRGKDSYIHSSWFTIQNPFGHAETSGGTDLETGAAETGIHPEAIRADGANRGMLVWCDAIVAAVRRVERALFHGRDALADAVNGSFHESRAGMVGVAIGIFAKRISIFEADEGQPAFGAEVHQVGEINDGGMR